MNVAIKIPTYNSEKTILDTLKSFINQTYVNFTIYIFDNCSTDNTLNLIESLRESRIRIIKSEKNYGYAWNFNRCLAATGEELMLFAHSDDIYHPKFLEINLEILMFNENSLIFSNAIFFKDKLRSSKLSLDINTKIQIDNYNSQEDLVKKVVTNGNFMFCPTAFGKSDIFSNIIGEFREDEFKGSADLEAWLRVSKFHSIIVIKKPILFFYRVSNTQLSYWDRKESASYFVRCIKFYLESIYSSSVKKYLLHYLSWHEIYHFIFINLGKEKSSKLFFLNSIFKVVCFRVNFIKKFKLISLLFISLIISFLPLNYRLKANSFLLDITRT
jgi:glycosyltransferase involved in cell wall biosynthesis